jgi:tRNA/rRNA methyltransferase
MASLVRTLEDALGTAGFYPPEKRDIIARNMRDMLHRMAMTEQDVRTLRGAIRALNGRRQRQG